MGLSWFKFWVTMQSHPKIASLSDGEFRLLVHVWCLACRSPEPGKVYVTPGVGLSPEQLVRGAGCDFRQPSDAAFRQPSDMVAALVRNRLIALAEDGSGVIEVHDWAEWNGRPASKQPDARREQGRKDRLRRKNVGRLSEANRKTEVEEEVEVEEEKETPLPPASAVGYDGRRTGFIRLLGQASGHMYNTPSGDYADRLDALLDLHANGIERAASAAGAAVRKTQKREGQWPGISYVLEVLRNLEPARPAPPGLREIDHVDAEGIVHYREAGHG